MALKTTLIVSENTHCRHIGYSFQLARKEGNVLFNDALNTFYLWVYGVGHMVRDHSDSERGNPMHPHRLLLSINSKVPVRKPGNTRRNGLFNHALNTFYLRVYGVRHMVKDLSEYTEADDPSSR